MQRISLSLVILYVVMFNHLIQRRSGVKTIIKKNRISEQPAKN